MKKWLNYHVVIDERRRCEKKISKTWIFICFCWQFCTFWVYTCSRFTTPGRRHSVEEPGISLFFFSKLFAITPKKMTQVHNEIFYTFPNSSNTCLCPVVDALIQFVGLWVICLKVMLDILASLPNNLKQKSPTSALSPHWVGRRMKLTGFHWLRMHDLGRSFIECFEKHLPGWKENKRLVNCSVILLCQK